MLLYRHLCSREMLDDYLSRALSIELEDKRLALVDKSKYVLTLDYTIKMLNIHERFSLTPSLYSLLNQLVMSRRWHATCAQAHISVMVTMYLCNDVIIEQSEVTSNSCDYPLGHRANTWLHPIILRPWVDISSEKECPV